MLFVNSQFAALLQAFKGIYGASVHAHDTMVNGLFLQNPLAQHLQPDT